MSIEFDRRIPIGFLLAVALQTAGLAFWLGQLSTRIDALESQVIRSQEQRDRLIAMEAQLRGIARIVEKIEAKQ